MTGIPAELPLLEANRRMREIVREIGPSVPVGYKVTGNCGKGVRTDTPWIGIFNPDISEKAQEGLYVAYLRHADSSAITLTVQQGIDELRQRIGASDAAEQLRLRAQRIRSAIALADDGDQPMFVGSGARQRLYSSGSIASRVYYEGKLAEEKQLTAELTSMLRILEAAHGILDETEAAGWVNQIEPKVAAHPKPVSMPRFVPKSSDDYFVELEPGSQVKNRRHEKIVNELERVATGLGWQVTSEHPIDLVMRRTDRGREVTAIVEVKTVPAGNSVDAVRAAIGQLFTYRFQRFDPVVRPRVDLVAAFSEDVGPALRELLTTELRIAVLWLDGHEWRGCALAHERGLLSSSATAEGG